jgi:hypothetical protein
MRPQVNQKHSFRIHDLEGLTREGRGPSRGKTADRPEEAAEEKLMRGSLVLEKNLILHFACFPLMFDYRSLNYLNFK